jgi:hypothetical protein
MEELEKKHVVNCSWGEYAVAEKPDDLAGHGNVEKTVVRQIIEYFGCVVENRQFRQSGYEHAQTADERAPV